MSKRARRKVVVDAELRNDHVELYKNKQIKKSVETQKCVHKTFDYRWGPFKLTSYKKKRKKKGKTFKKKLKKKKPQERASIQAIKIFYKAIRTGCSKNIIGRSRPHPIFVWPLRTVIYKYIHGTRDINKKKIYIYISIHKIHYT